MTMGKNGLALPRIAGQLIILLVVAAFAGGSALAPLSHDTTPRFARLSDDSVVHGERLARILGCLNCHDTALTGEDWSEAGFVRLWTSNLTRAVPQYSDMQLAAAIRRGRRHDGMPLWDMPSPLFARLSDADMAALVSYLRRRPPQGPVRPLPVLEAGAFREIAAGTYRSAPANVARIDDAVPADLGPELALGRHIVRATCAECHGFDLRGGIPYPGAAARPDLRIAAGYDDGQFARLMTTGIAIGNRDVGLMRQVARGRYKYLAPAERGAVRDYLHALAQAYP